MLKLIIEDDEGRKTVVPFVRDEITIGRQEGNTIRLTERNVSRRHARLVRLNGHVVLEDLGSYNGTRINGERVAGQLPLKEGDLIQIGDYDLALQVEGAANAGPPAGAITAKVPASRRPEPEEDDAPRATMSDGEDEEEEDDDGDEHDHTPPSAADVRRNATSIIRMDQMEADRPRRVERVPEDEQPRLLVLGPTEFKGQEYDCNRTELRIGRTSENDVALDHRSLSRTHAKIVREETGEWRVIDMQSANGLTVNGESYAQATLAHGDIIEMGHVKLRFVGPGSLAEDIAAQGRSGSKKMLVAAVIAFVSIGAGAALFVVKGQDLLPKPPDATPPVVAEQQTPPEPAQDPKPPETVATRPTPPDKTAPETPAVDPKALEQEFEKTLAAAELDKAGAAIASLQQVKGYPGARLKDYQRRLDVETKAKQQIDAAEAALQGNRPTDAGSALKGFPTNTVAFASRYETVKKQADEAQRLAAEAAATSAKPPQLASEYMKNKKAADVVRDIGDIQAKVRAVLKEDANGALAIAKDCAALAPNLPECHLMLGVTYATLKDFKMSVDHYTKFLTLTEDGYPKRDLVIKALAKINGTSAPTQNPPASSNGE
ncbi:MULTISPECIES: FHA domain-containing protein [Corallococcus]|uniref:FHA domain-containing protein n=1 Tax=Corallococcus TaxID=83461 RepID=UPI00117C8A6D|nr:MULTISPECIES: FHA domain-containing protein [Corallococcus]NBD09095.1 FHA domain-containing protein [Corallococcus silvisoli]TSC33023.1 FHA domain-containing protein [Corallococcus sp. Z5C101001]